jgi:tRNA pseudouridine55 synthase
MHGILLIDKPEGYTSHQIVKIVKRRLGNFKVGHTGTLDPAATGLLVILVGVASRALDYLDETKKRYILGVRLGEATDTCDREGQVIRTSDVSHITKQDILKSIPKFLGSITQIPPHFSAIKKDGAPLYKLARKGIFPEIKPRAVQVFELELTDFSMPDIQLDMSCSKGTYARAIARDLGEELAVGARLETLRRTSSGPFEVSQAVDLEFIQKASLTEIHTSIIPLDKVLENIPRIMTGASELKRLSTGGALKISIDRIPGEYLSEKYLQSPFRVSAPSSGLLIIVRLKIDGDSVVVSPEKLFNWLESSLV